MKYTPNKGFEKYIKFLLEFFRERLGLVNYTTKVEFVNYIPNDRYRPKIIGGYTAQIEIDEIYLEFRITISKILEDYFLKNEGEKIICTLLHELCHWFTEPYDELCGDLLGRIPPDKRRGLNKKIVEVNERQTELIAAATRRCMGEVRDI